MDESIRHDFKLRHKTADKGSRRILIQALFDGIIDTHRIDTGGSRLHLYLGPMNAGFVVDKLPRQMQPAGTPRQPQIVAGK